MGTWGELIVVKWSEKCPSQVIVLTMSAIITIHPFITSCSIVLFPTSKLFVEKSGLRGRNKSRLKDFPGSPVA